MTDQSRHAMAEELERLKTQVAATRQEALDEAWRAVDAEGGTHSPAHHETGYAAGYNEALRYALDAIERLGGRDASAGIYAEVAKLRAEKAQMLEALKKYGDHTKSCELFAPKHLRPAFPQCNCGYHNATCLK